MAREMHPSRRSLVLLGAALAAGGALSGCTSSWTDTTSTDAGSAKVAVAPAAATSTTSGGDLSTGLLPDDAFGQGATVKEFPLDGMPGPWGMPGRWSHHDDEDGDGGVAPPECKAALDKARSQFTGVQDAAGKVGWADSTRTVEVLAVPKTQGDAVAAFRSVTDACGSVSFDRGPGNGSVKLEALTGLPDGAAGVSVTFTGTYPGGSWSSTALAAVAQDGDRVLGLAEMSHDGTSLDKAAFTDLLSRAYQVQADALD
jgi:hypothetical protein